MAISERKAYRKILAKRVTQAERKAYAEESVKVAESRAREKARRGSIWRQAGEYLVKRVTAPGKATPTRRTPIRRTVHRRTPIRRTPIRRTIRRRTPIRRTVHRRTSAPKQASSGYSTQDFFNTMGGGA